MEAVLGHVVDALARVDAGLLGLLGEGHDVRGHAELLPQPRGAGAEEARLHLVEDQQRFLLVRVGAQLLQELGPEVVVAALRLHGLDQDRRDLALVLGEGALDLGAGARLGSDDVIGDPAVEVELDAGVVHARPAELGEQARLRGIRVGERERVARAAVEGVLEVQHDEVVAALVQVAPAELLRLPVEGHLDRVLVGEGAAGDPEVVREARGRHARREGLDEARHRDRVEVGVGRVVARGGEQLGRERRLAHARVVVADRPRREAGEEVEQVGARARVVEPRAVALVQIEHEAGTGVGIATL